jgi:hypothetical protein
MQLVRPSMITADEVGTKTEQIDRQIIDLLEQRAQVCRDFAGAEDGGVEDPSELIGWWVEEGAERGLDEGGMERICRGMLTLCRKPEE